MFPRSEIPPKCRSIASCTARGRHGAACPPQRPSAGLVPNNHSSIISAHSTARASAGPLSGTQGLLARRDLPRRDTQEAPNRARPPKRPIPEGFVAQPPRRTSASSIYQPRGHDDARSTEFFVRIPGPLLAACVLYAAQSGEGCPGRARRRRGGQQALQVGPKLCDRHRAYGRGVDHMLG